MKQHVREVYENLVRDGRPLAASLSETSLQRFLRDPRIWPVEAWFAVPREDGSVQVQHWAFQPDPRFPEPGEDPLERSWLMRDTHLDHNPLASVAECSQQVIEKLQPANLLEQMLGIYWMDDTGIELPELRKQCQPDE